MYKTSESGQSLLIIVLLVSIVFTIIATASYRLSTQSQSSRLQEESIRTLAAADSGIERGIQYANDNAETPVNAGGTREVTYLSLGMTLPGIDPVRSTLEVTADVGNSFVSPLTAKDEQYTFYLHKFPDGGGNLNTNLDIAFADSLCPNTNGPAVEVSLIYGNNGQNIQRWVVDPCGIITSSSGELTASATPTTINGVTMRYRATIPVASFANNPNPAQLLIVRVLGRASNIGFITSGTFYSQGQFIRSEAVSTNGTTKIVSLFKSYPQIPADFFVTRF